MSPERRRRTIEAGGAGRMMIEELRRWCQWYPRFGSERVHQLLFGTGWRVNFKREYRPSAAAGITEARNAENRIALGVSCTCRAGPGHRGIADRQPP